MCLIKLSPPKIGMLVYNLVFPVRFVIRDGYSDNLCQRQVSKDSYSVKLAADFHKERVIIK